MLEIEKLTLGENVGYKQVEKLTQEEGMTDAKVIKIAEYDNNPNELSAQDLEAYENGLIDFEAQQPEEDKEGKKAAEIKNDEKVEYDEEEQKYYVTLDSKINNCLARVIRNQYGVEMSTDEGKEIMEQIIEMNPQIYDSNRRGTQDVMGIKGSGSYIYAGEKMYLPNGDVSASAPPAGEEVPTPGQEELNAQVPPASSGDDTATPPSSDTITPPASSEGGTVPAPSAAEVEVPENIKGLVEGIESAIDTETNWSADATAVTKLVDSASPEQMYELDTYWNAAKGTNFSAQIQQSLGIQEDNELIISIESKIQEGETIAKQKAQAEIQETYQSMPQSSREAADTLSAMLIDGSEELDEQKVYDTILKLYNDKTTQLDAYWQQAYGTTLAETVSGHFEGQNAQDMAAVINARINNPTRSRSTDEMAELKTNLANILTTEPVDRNALSGLLIGENVSTQAMQALDKYCRENLGTTLAAAVYSNSDIENSTVLINWLKNYKIVPSTSKKAQETGEALAEALSKNGDSWGIDKDSVCEILANYSDASQESLLNLNDYWASTYGCSLVDEMQNYTEFRGQEQEDLISAVKAKLSGKSIPRTTDEMTELKTNLASAIESGDTSAISDILIDSNITKNAMSALDKYCRSNYGNKSLLTVLQEQNLASDALIKWLKSYGLA